MIRPPLPPPPPPPPPTPPPPLPTPPLPPPQRRKERRRRKDWDDYHAPFIQICPLKKSGYRPTDGQSLLQRCVDASKNLFKILHRNRNSLVQHTTLSQLFPGKKLHIYELVRSNKFIFMPFFQIEGVNFHVLSGKKNRRINYISFLYRQTLIQRAVVYLVLYPFLLL